MNGLTNIVMLNDFLDWLIIIINLKLLDSTIRDYIIYTYIVYYIFNTNIIKLLNHNNGILCYTYKAVQN